MRLSILAVAAVSAVLWLDCGDGGNPGGGGGDGGTLSCGSRECGSAEMLDGKTWMTENLNKTTADSWCYEDSPDSCAKYGRLYTWNEAKTICLSIGWRLPDTADWNTLVNAVGGRDIAGGKLKSESGWSNVGNSNGNGTNDFQFSALPGASRGANGGFWAVGVYGYWWTITQNSDVNAYAYAMSMINSNNRVKEDAYDKGSGLSVRCVKN